MTHNTDGSLNSLTSDDLAPLFVAGKPEEWPNLVLTSNHARAGKSSDLSELMQGIEQMAHDAWGKPLDLHRFTKEDRAAGKPNVKNKTIIALACHTERDIFLNGAELLDRRLDLEEDKLGNADPSKRTLTHISPASMRLAKLIMKLMVEPDPAMPTLVDLDRATDYKHIDDPFIANDHDRGLVLRADAPSIAQHIKLVGYSRGANTVTDALRFLHLEYAKLGPRLQQRSKDGSTHAVTQQEMKQLVGNIGLLSLAPGEVPLTKAERDIVGIHRVTILNTHDLTAGHLVNPDAADYDRWADRLVRIDGTRADSGHSIGEAMGKKGKTGYIMDPAHANDAHYRTAQDEVRAFFASNHQKQAIATACFSQEGGENVLYAQFAPGISRANEKAVEAHLLACLNDQGFAHATVTSDFADRRRMRIVLDQDGATQPIVQYTKDGRLVECSKEKIDRCQNAFAALSQPENGQPFVTQEVLGYMEHVKSQFPANVIGAGYGRVLGSLGKIVLRTKKNDLL
ncbi:MAG: hypothetical protein V4735_00480 [Pseudomonadota bacterium]